MLERALRVSNQLKGLIDGDRLKKFNDNIRRIKNQPRAPAFIYSLTHLFMKPPEPRGGEDYLNSFNLMAGDLRNLQQLYSFVQRGQWEKAREACKSLRGFDWADKMTPEVFLELHQLNKVPGMAADPRVWGLLAGGKKNLDALLALLEREVEQAEKKLSDNFFNLDKGLESLAALQVNRSTSQID